MNKFSTCRTYYFRISFPKLRNEKMTCSSQFLTTYFRFSDEGHISLLPIMIKREDFIAIAQ